MDAKDNLIKENYNNIKLYQVCQNCQRIIVANKDDCKHTIWRAREIVENKKCLYVSLVG